MISKTERTELRAVVRQQFKVLRAEIRQREAELRAETQEELARQVGTEDKQWSDIEFLANEAIREANRKINDALRAQDMAHPDSGLEYSLVELGWQFRSLKKKTDQAMVKQRAEAAIKERVRRAELGLERQEADLLRSLAVDAIESEEARTFLNGIPTVGELVPSTRLGELLASVEVDDRD